MDQLAAAGRLNCGDGLKDCLDVGISAFAKGGRRMFLKGAGSSSDYVVRYISSLGL